MKKTICMLFAFLTISAHILTGCDLGPKYCAEPGCPKEVIRRGSDYCTAHVCANLNCKNKALGGFSDYCEECLTRAENK